MNDQPLNFCAFVMNTPSHIIHGLWRDPEGDQIRYNELDLWVDLAPMDPDNRVLVGLDQVALPFDDVRQRAFSEDFILEFPPPIQALTATSLSRDWSTSGP